MTRLFPVSIDLQGRSCLIIGGGKVAARKAENLLEYGCQVTMVSPRCEETVSTWAKNGLITYLQREFKEEDLDHSFLVFIATDDRGLNSRISSLCRERGILVNAVDDPPHCDFYVPAILRRGPLTLAISTEGKSPAFAGRLRRDLEEIITDDYGKFVEILGEQREYIKENISDLERRKAVFEKLVYSDILDLLKAGEEEKAREKVQYVCSAIGVEP